MRLLFIGDSITRGRVGESFVRILQKTFPQHQFINRGRNGDALLTIAERLNQELLQQSYDTVFLQGGYGDLLIPLFKKRNRLFRFAYLQQLKKGIVPIISEGEFEAALRHIVQNIKSLHKGSIVLFTIGPVGEWQNTATNRKRAVFNAIIQQVAAEEKICVADVAVRMDAFLCNKVTQNFCLQGFWDTVFTDRVRGRLFGWDQISQCRGLHLTFDGVHLNTQGTQLMSEAVIPIIQHLGKERMVAGKGMMA
jgi:lysophospholipase L1-like esterase